MLKTKQNKSYRVGHDCSDLAHTRAHAIEILPLEGIHNYVWPELMWQFKFTQLE